MALVVANMLYSAKLRDGAGDRQHASHCQALSWHWWSPTCFPMPSLKMALVVANMLYSAKLRDGAGGRQRVPDRQLCPQLPSLLRLQLAVS